MSGGSKTTAKLAPNKIVVPKASEGVWVPTTLAPPPLWEMLMVHLEVYPAMSAFAQSMPNLRERLAQRIVRDVRVYVVCAETQDGQFAWGLPPVYANRVRLAPTRWRLATEEEKLRIVAVPSHNPTVNTSWAILK